MQKGAVQEMAALFLALSLLPLEGGAPKGRRLDGDSGISETKPSPRGEGGERSEPDRVLAV